MNNFVRRIAMACARGCRGGATALAAASLLMAAHTADAAGPRTELLSGNGWQASPNGVNGWIPAYAPYPNPVTMPNPFLNEFGIHADLMWYWPGPGTPTASSPPSTAYFRHQFRLEAENGVKPQIVALMAADDEMTLIVNGITVASYRLADHIMPNGQPEALAVDMTQALRIGDNQIDIRATDNGIYHWVFFDSYNIFRPTEVLVPRAPGQISLIGDKDDFHPDDPADTAPKSQHVLDLQDKLLPTPAIDLDQPAVNQSVGLTHDVSVPEGATITSASVKLHIRMTGDVVDNDVLLFNQSTITNEGLSTRVIALHDLLGFPPQAGATYDLIWNLAKTPLRNVASPIVTGQPDQVVNLLPMLVSDQRVDVLLADGTMVDYSELSVTYTSVSAAPGDLNNDGAVDRADVSILLLGLNTLASGPNDPRDFDRDGRITALDVRKLVAGCSHPLCN
ncbi:dockerin type I domain-containing protein [Janthinobacterium sp. JC611]|uniref:dockerin type I domain-containing protein n=1 Tax=Janthinobacterium sp. JC611 TaxID=2816201 RepID=UPI001BFEEAF7|nr:dockerin type I domain-containing protein [Janthinobacterium sp. JC611]